MNLENQAWQGLRLTCKKLDLKVLMTIYLKL